jgi:biotin operon repressor
LAGGFFKAPREILDRDEGNPFYGDGLLLAMYLLLRGRAAYKDGPLAKRGQVLTSQDRLGEQLGLARQPTRGLLKKLEKLGKINQQTNHHHTLITVLDYEENSESWPDSQPTEQPTSNQPPTNRQPYKKKDRRIEGKNTSPCGDVLSALWGEHRGRLPAIQRMTRERILKVEARWKESPDAGYWEAAIKRLAASDFAASGSWATFDWLVKNDTNHVKAAEGNYDNPASKPDQAGKDRDSVKFEEI